MSQTTSFINMHGNSKKNKKLQINSTLYTFILLYCLLSFQKCPSFVYPSQSFSFLFSFLLPFSPSCLHSHKELVLILSCILISLEFGCIAPKFTCNSETLFQWSRTNFLEGSSYVLSSFPDLFCTSHCWNYPDKYWGHPDVCVLVTCSRLSHCCGTTHYSSLHVAYLPVLQYGHMRICLPSTNLVLVQITPTPKYPLFVVPTLSYL